MTELVMVVGVRCQACVEAKEALSALQTEYPDLSITEVDIESGEGYELAMRARATVLPVIFLDGRALVSGKVEEAELRSRIIEAMAVS